jgi:hypothetical protein
MVTAQLVLQGFGLGRCGQGFHIRQFEHGFGFHELFLKKWIPYKACKLNR